MVDIAGIRIPSDSPVFLTGVGIHIVAGLICVAAGAVAMLSRKAKGRHPSFGTTYFWSLSVVFASSTVLAAMRWQEDYLLFALGCLAFLSALVGRTALRRRWPAWVHLHISGMGGSYVLLLTAFYVDNGKSLPIWKELPPIAYWLVPAAVGLPLIIWALIRHPLARRPPLEAG